MVTFHSTCHTGGCARIPRPLPPTAPWTQTGHRTRTGRSNGGRRWRSRPQPPYPRAKDGRGEGTPLNPLSGERSVTLARKRMELAGSRSHAWKSIKVVRRLDGSSISSFCSGGHEKETKGQPSCNSSMSCSLAGDVLGFEVQGETLV